MSAIFSFSPFVDVLIFFLLFSSWATYKITQRSQIKSGCLSLGYIWLVIFFIGVFSASIVMLLVKSTYNNIQAIAYGTPYTAIVVDYSSHQGEDSEGSTQTYYTPIFSLTLDDGQTIQKKADYSSTGKPDLGEEYTVFYNVKTGHLFIWGYTFVVMLIGLLLMGSILFMSLYGIGRYASGYDMKSYWRLLSNFLLKGFIPFVMIAFDALLIYALVHKEQPLFIKVILVFFITILTLAIPGFIKATKSTKAVTKNKTRKPSKKR